MEGTIISKKLRTLEKTDVKVKLHKMLSPNQITKLRSCMKCKKIILHDSDGKLIERNEMDDDEKYTVYMVISMNTGKTIGMKNITF